MTFLAANPELERRAKDAFNEIVDLPASERAAALDRVVGDDAPLRSRVQSLLEANDRAEGFLAPPPPLFGFDLDRALADRPAKTSDADDPLINQHIARYRIIRRLGAGGMGVVYLAEQDQPKRTVALKLMRAGAASRSMLRRFRHEAEVLGHLHHPGIAQIHEAGTFNLGRGEQPYFAMEFIDGPSLTRYASTRDLSSRARLQLLADVCDAVHHAHQKGVVHRDLKPDNILVVEEGIEASRHQRIEERAAAVASMPRSLDASVPQPKILDFGVARLTGSDLTLTAMQTAAGQFLGTLPYMSPEQLGADASRIDVRSDVYALGVIGFELLTGALPLDVRNKTLAEAARIIQHDEPLSLTRFSRALRGDVSTIISKAMEKERDRRYASASEFAEDIRRSLRDEPIAARPTTTLYQLRKFARRNRTLVAGAAGVFLALVLGVVGTSIGLVRARDAARVAEQQKQLALASESDAQAQRRLTEASEQEALRQRETAQQISDFLQQMLASVNPAIAQGRDTALLMDILASASARLHRELDDQPQIAATLHGVIGRTYSSISQFEQAIEHLELALMLHRRAEGDESIETAQAAGDLARTLIHATQFDRAYPLLLESLTTIRRLRGPNDPLAAQAMAALANHRHLLGAYQEAEHLLREALAIITPLADERDPLRLAITNSLADVLTTRRKFAEALSLLKRLLEIRQQDASPDSPELAQAHANLARVLGELKGGDPEVLEHLNEADAIYRRILPAHHITRIKLSLRIGAALYAQSEWDQAQQVLEETLQTARQSLGENHPVPARILYTLANLAHARGEHRSGSEGERLCLEALDIRRQSLPHQHPDIAQSLQQLAMFRETQNRRSDAIQLLHEAMAITQHNGAAEYDTCRILSRLGDLEWRFGDLVKGEQIQRDAIACLINLLGETAQSVSLAMARLAQNLEYQNRDEEALEIYLKIADNRLNDPLERQNEVGGALESVGRMFVRLERYEQALGPLQRAISIFAAIWGEENLATCRARSDLGAALTHLRRFDEAETNLLIAERVWGARYPTSPPTRQMHTRLAALYRAWEKPDAAAEWERKIDQQ